MAPPYRIVIWQILATAAVSAALFLLEVSGGGWDEPFRGLNQAVAALAAGTASVIPAALFAWRAAVERSPGRFLLQGVAKFMLTILLIAAWIVLIELAAAGFFGTLILLQLMYVVEPLVRNGRLKDGKTERQTVR